MINVLGATQALMIANAFTRNTFELGLFEFLMSDEKTNYGGRTSGARITLRELMSGAFKVHGTTGKTEVQLALQNMQKNAVPLIASMVLIPVGFKAGKKILAKPLINPINRGLKQFGLASTVKV